MIRQLALCAFLPTLFACQEGGFGTRTDGDETGLEDADYDGFPSDQDCNDLDAEVYPGAPELCGDGRITDCNRLDPKIGETRTVTVRDTGFDDLQEALNFAEAGDEVLICPGTYVGTFIAPVSVHMRALTGPTDTIVTGQGAKIPGTTLLVRTGSKLEGLTITGGAASGDPGTGGGVVLADLEKGTLELDTCVVTGNTAFDGAGLYLPPDSVVTLRSTTIEQNTAFGSGGGAFLESGSLLRLEDSSVITGNTARTGGGAALVDARLEGGEITGNNAVDTGLPKTVGSLRTLRSPGGSGVVAEGRSTVASARITANQSTGVSGGAVMALSGAELTLNNVNVANNVTQQRGGGLEIRDATVQMLGNSEVFGNVSSGNMGSGALIEGGRLSGGVIRDHKTGSGIVVSNAEINNVVVRGNEAITNGGGIDAKGIVTLTGVTVADNKATTGGGIYYQRDGVGGKYKLTLSGCTVRGNRSDAGGGIYGESVLLSNTDISQNVAGRGGGLYIVRQLEIGSSTIYGNKALLGGRSGGGGIHYQPRSGDGYPGLPISVVDGSFGLAFGPQDNDPDDVSFVGLTDNYSYAYGEHEIFDCLASTGCAAIPQ